MWSADTSFKHQNGKGRAILNNENQNSPVKGNNRIILGQATSVEIQSLAATHQLEMEEPFPALRSRRWNPKDDLEGEYPLETDLVVSQDVLQAVDHHTRRYLEKEVGGFLLGNLYVCPNTDRKYVLIDQIWRARYTIGNEVSLRLTADTWADLADQMQTKFRGKLLAGWYHSHPRMSVFLSEDDLEIHAQRFEHPWMFALVVEPVSREGGFFGVCNGEVNPRRPLPFHEFYSHRAVRSVVDWNNYECREHDLDHDLSLMEIISLPDPQRAQDPAVAANRLPMKHRRSNLLTLLVPFLSILLTGISIIAINEQPIREWHNILSQRSENPAQNLPTPEQTIPKPPVIEPEQITNEPPAARPKTDTRTVRESARDRKKKERKNKKPQVSPANNNKKDQRGDKEQERTTPSPTNATDKEKQHDGRAGAHIENSETPKADSPKSTTTSGTSDLSN